MKNLYFLFTLIFLFFQLSIHAQDAGTTPGELSVSQTGSANYNVPIMVPPGIKGIVPEIALTYNSQGGNGLAGWGWNVSGISTITRISPTEFHDGNKEEVNFSNSDRYALNGQRLILKSGTYGADGSVYETENFSNIKVKAFGTSPYGSGARYFIVYYPDGTRAWHGAYNSISHVEWSIWKWEDPQGNFMEYSYDKSNNLLRITQIEYGSRAGTAAPNKINFYYKTRSRAETSYINGTRFIRTNILDRIETSGNGQLYRKYKLNHYNTSLGYQTLFSVKEFNAFNDELAPIQFGYEYSPDEIIRLEQFESSSIAPEVSSETSETLVGDYTGNGKMDLISYYKNNKTKINLYTDLYKGANLNLSTEIITGTFQEIISGPILSHNNIVLPQHGITTINEVAQFPTDDKSRVFFKTFAMSATGAIFQYNKTWLPPKYRLESACGTSSFFTIPKEYVSGDFNGDGLMDVIALTKPYTEQICERISCDDGDPNDPQQLTTGEQDNSGSTDCCECNSFNRTASKSYFIDLNRNKTSNFSNYSGQLQMSLSPEDRVIAADVTGDGKTNLVHIKNGILNVYELDANNVLSLVTSISDTYIKTDVSLLFGDYNGDGKIDFMAPTAIGSRTWRFFLFTGNSFEPYSKETTIAYRSSYTIGSTLHEIHWISQDMNGDGKTDILKHDVALEISGNTRESLSVWSNGATGNWQPVFEERIGNKAFYPTGSERFGIPIFLDTKFSNRNPEYAYISGDKINVYEFTQDHRENVTLKTIGNNGVTTRIEYQPLSPIIDSFNGNSIYTGDFGETYPYTNVNIAPNVQLVRHLEVTGANSTSKQDFAYHGAVTHATGLGFMGFKRLHRSNWYGEGVTQLWNSSIHDPQKRGATTLEWLANYRSPTPGNYASKNEYTYSTALQSNKVFINLVTSTETEDFLQGVTNIQTTLYDVYNNPINITTANDAGTVTEEYTYANNHTPFNQNYHIGRPLTRKTTSSIAGDTFVSEQAYTYTANLVKTSKTRGVGTPWVTETYSYDAYGNITQKQLSGSGMTTRIEGFSFTIDGRFLLTETDVEGLVTTYENDPYTGNLTKVTDPYGRENSFTYDGWNRIISEIDYVGKITTYTFTQLSDGSIEIFTNYDQDSDSYEYINALGQSYLINVLTLNGQWIKTSYKYDAVGRLVEASEPYWSNASPSQWNKTNYDEWGRPIEQISYTGRTTTTSYNGLSTTVNDGTKSKTTTINGAGDVVKVMDPGGEINYTYFANGELKTATYNGQTQSTTIDAWGRRTQLIDPSSGTYTYEYNLFGEMTQQTTPKGTSNYTFNGLGKLTKMTVVGDETDLELNYSYNGDNLLGGISGEDKKFGKYYTYALTYDAFKRPTKITEANNLAYFEKRLVYDSYGRTYRETYITQNKTDNTTNNIATIYGYDNESGLLEQIKDNADNSVLWQLDEHDARGLSTSISLGNGFTKARTYDAYGLPQQMRDTKDDGNTVTNALRMNYSFNATRGILNSRENINLNWEENFNHDSLDRLTEISGPAPRNQSYDTMGRIGANSGIGTYGYDDTKKYRLASLDLNDDGQSHYANNSTQQITYNAFKKPVDIYEENKGRVSFEYGVLGNRAHAWYGGQQTDKTERRFHKHYASIMPAEIVEDKETGDVKIITYLGGNAYTAPIAHIKSKTGTANGFHYLHRDYLGSILAITDEDGALKEQRQFGAWGTVDKFVASNGDTNFGHASLLNRGYTGHEHFFEVGLIHMNGRMYDPVLGRFLSPDNFIQDPYNTQNYNRYGYVLNNPLVLTDPTGEMSEGGWLGWLLPAIFSSLAASWDWLTGGNGSFFSDIKASLKSRKRLLSGSPISDTSIPTTNISVDPLVRASPNIASGNTSSGLGSFWQQASDFGSRLAITTAGALNSFGSNLVLGFGRRNADSLDSSGYGGNFRAGQFAGDIASIFTGFIEINAGIALTTGSAIVIPLSGGLSLSGVTAGYGLIGHGISTIGFGTANGIRSGRNFADYFGKNKGTKSSFPRDFSSRNTVNKSAKFKSEREARNLARRKIGKNPIKVGENKFRSKNGVWQYRAKKNDLTGHGPNDSGHIHLERLDPVTGEVLENWHLRW